MKKYLFFFQGGWQQAGNIIRLEPEGPWMCEIPEMWQGTFNEELVLKDMINPKVGSLYGFVVPKDTKIISWL